MKKLLYLLSIIAIWACNDGDLDIETIDFESGEPQYCGTLLAEEASLLFKLNEQEALIVELPATALTNEASDGTLSFAVPGSAQVIYRIFNGAISNDYFCSDLPLTEPTVASEITAVGGTVFITTTTTDTLNYIHKIELSEISLVNAENSRITDLSIAQFGSVSTTK